MSHLRKILPLVGLFSLGAGAIAQPAPAEFRAGLDKLGATKTNEYATVYWQAQLGSFKVIDGEGRLRFSFEGSVMVNAANAQVEVTGNVRKELEKRQRVVYRGKGTITISGKWRGVQFFGRNIDAMMYGRGVIQLTGEFFRDPKTGELVTGTYWYDDPKNKQFWFANGLTTVYLPPLQTPNQVVPQERKR